MALADVAPPPIISLSDIPPSDITGAAASNGYSEQAAQRENGVLSDILTASSSKYATPVDSSSQKSSPGVESPEPSLSDLEPEDDLNMGGGLFETSDKRKAQNVKFTNWSVAPCLAHPLAY